MRRSAFTIVELLVTIAIIGILLGLLLPAVQAAREAARRASCKNKLRQIALATNGFHDTHNRFPPGQFLGPFGAGTDSHAWSWLARILPYLEENSIFDEGKIPERTLRESGVAGRTIPTFLCPSDPHSHTGPRIDAGNLDGMLVGQTNYKGVSGANWGADESLALDDIGTLWPNEGANGSFDGYAHGDGILWRSDYSARMARRRVGDGLSATFLVGEDLPEKNRWCSWPYANNAYGTCAIPPNFTYEDTLGWYNTWSFRSDHSGGLNFALADGSVRFVDEAISLEVYRALATRDGEEIVGEF